MRRLCGAVGLAALALPIGAVIVFGSFALWLLDAVAFARQSGVDVLAHLSR